jgi:photosystem II stability/assembly factor-like uncharacterized protein
MSTNATPQVYAGTGGHSAWFSLDKGDTWVRPNSHSGLYLEASVWALASHPAVPESILAGTNMGLFRWDEPTARWTHVASPMNDIWSIVFDPDNPKVIFAGTRPAAFYASADGGVTWEKLNAPGIAQSSEINRGPTRVTQILFDPVVRDTIWACVEIGGMYRSRDRGKTWEFLVKGMISGDMHGAAVIPEANGGRSILTTSNAGLQRSEDGGDSWRPEKLDSPWQYTRAIVPHPSDPRTLFLTNGDGPPGTTGRLLRSKDGGRSWEVLPLPGRLNSTPWAVATHRADPKLMFVGTNCGQIFRSADGGDTWARLAHEFGELRALHWRPLTVPQGEHSLVFKRLI